MVYRAVWLNIVSKVGILIHFYLLCNNFPKKSIGNLHKHEGRIFTFGIVAQYDPAEGKFQFIYPIPDTPFSCFGKKRAKRSRHRSGLFTKTPPPMYHPSETGKACIIFTKRASVPTCALPNFSKPSYFSKIGRAARAEPPPSARHALYCHVVRTPRGISSACGWGT